MREVVEGIFTPQRIAELVDDLKSYRDQLFSTGHKAAALYAVSAIEYVQPEDDPAQNTFLLNLCAKSFHRKPASDGQEAEPSSGSQLNLAL